MQGLRKCPEFTNKGIMTIHCINNDNKDSNDGYFLLMAYLPDT